MIGKFEDASSPYSYRLQLAVDVSSSVARPREKSAGSRDDCVALSAIRIEESTGLGVRADDHEPTGGLVLEDCAVTWQHVKLSRPTVFTGTIASPADGRGRTNAKVDRLHSQLAAVDYDDPA